MQTSVVLASEIDAPAGIKPVQWRLLTNRLVETPELIDCVAHRLPHAAKP